MQIWTICIFKHNVRIMVDHQKYCKSYILYQFEIFYLRIFPLYSHRSRYLWSWYQNYFINMSLHFRFFKLTRASWFICLENLSKSIFVAELRNYYVHVFSLHWLHEYDGANRWKCYEIRFSVVGYTTRHKIVRMLQLVSFHQVFQQHVSN